MFYSCLSIVHYYITTTIDAFYPQLAISLNVLSQITFAAFCNLYKPLIVSGIECIGMEVMLKYFGEYKGNKNN